MKSLLRLGLIGVALVGAVAAAYAPLAGYWRMRNQPQYRTAEVSRGEVMAVVNSTGTVKPVLTVQVGSFVSGPILELSVDFNDRVKKGAVMARIDPLIYKSNVARDEAVFATREADVFRAAALLQLAKNDERRSIALRATNKDFISDAEMDQFKFNRMSLEAQLKVAEATVKQAKGSLDNSMANLGYTEIVSPVDGIVIDRKIQPGQTIAAQFQTPELFTIAPEMEKKMHVFASVDEADIGLIRDAQLRKQPVRFTVDAYPDDLFEGEIEQVRISSTTTQNVVTYPVVVAAPNPELKLLPGMTASLSFLINRKTDVLRISNAALRFYPDIKQVRAEDQQLLDGSLDSTEGTAPGERTLSAMEKAEAGKSRNRRHVWVEDHGLLKAVEVITGISDSKNTEVVSADLKEGDPLVTGIQPPKTN
jgi:HlyD family secretion protein